MQGRRRIVFIVSGLLAIAAVAALSRQTFNSPPPVPVSLAESNTLIVDSFNDRVIEVTRAKQIVWQYGTPGARGNGIYQLSLPSNAVRLMNGNTLIADAGNYRVIEVRPDNQLVWDYGTGTAGSNANQLHSGIAAVRLLNDDTLIADSLNHRVIEVTRYGAHIVWQYGTTASSGSGTNQLNQPHDVSVVPGAGRHVLIADTMNQRVIEVTPANEIVWQYGTTGMSGHDDNQLSEPVAAKRLSNGNTLITDHINNRVIEVTPGKTIAWKFDPSDLPEYMYRPRNANRLPNGNTVITDTFAHRVIEVTASKELVWQDGTTGVNGSGDNQLRLPSSAGRLPIFDNAYDIDGDGVPDRLDNCPFLSNPDQGPGPDGIGALCSRGPLKRIYWEQTAATELVTTVRDTSTGNLVVRLQNGDYYAFQRLVSSKAKVSFISIPGVSPSGKSVEISNCNLVYQDGDNGSLGKFLEIYGADGTSPCTFQIKSGPNVLVSGAEVVLVVVTDVNTGKGRVFGRTTLSATDGSQEGTAIFNAIASGSAERYMYLYFPDMTLTAPAGQGRSATASAIFVGNGYAAYR